MAKNILVRRASAILGDGALPAWAEASVDDGPEAMAAIRRLLDGISEDRQLKVFGSRTPSDDALRALERALAALTAENHDVSLVMVDIRTRSGVALWSDRVMCTQSTVKAIYTGALLDGDPSLFEKNEALIRLAIRHSDNDAYAALRKNYGSAPLERWCRDCGVDASFAGQLYPRKSVKEMCKLWTRMYLFLNGDRAPEALRACLADSACSSAGEVLGKRALVQSKAGWENGLGDDAAYSPDMTYPAAFTDKDPYNDECAINDTGLVYTEKGPYLFAVFTDWPFGNYRDHAQPNPLGGLTEALYSLQQSLAE